MEKEKTKTKRTDWLTDTAKEKADILWKRYGSLKMVLSGGVMVMSEFLNAEEREYFMALAAGEENPPNVDIEKTRLRLRPVVEELVGEAVERAIAQKLKRDRKRSKSR